MTIAYDLNTYMKALFATAGEDLEFFPGKWASADPNATQPSKLVTYTLKQGRSFGQPYIRIDSIRVNIYHPLFLTLQNLVGILLEEFGQENMADNTSLTSAMTTAGFKLHDIIATVVDNGQNTFIDSTNNYVASVDIIVEYVEVS
jgi:hypothetical protein